MLDLLLRNSAAYYFLSLIVPQAFHNSCIVRALLRYMLRHVVILICM